MSRNSIISSPHLAEKAVSMKLLCPAHIAGSLIGPGGRIVRSVIDGSGARVVISGPTEFYPESQDRVVLVLGAAASIKRALLDIVTRVCMVRIYCPRIGLMVFSHYDGYPQYIMHVAYLNQAIDKNETGAPSVQLDNFGCLVSVPAAPATQRPQQIRVLIPNAFSKVLIGRNGSNVKLICDLSGSRIQLAEPTPDMYNTNERIVAITAPSVDKLVTVSGT